MAAIFYHDGKWYDEDPKIIGPMCNAFWFGSAVFDGARAFDGFAPDLDRHCARVVESAKKMGMNPPVDADEVLDITARAIRKLPKDSAYYVRPMIYPDQEGGGMVPHPDNTDWLVAIHEVPLPPADGFTAGKSSFRRPAPDQAPTDTKASCLYPNGMRALREAKQNGFDNALVMDPYGKVAEFANANLFFVKDGVVKTPEINGTFLNGITRQRVIALLADAGEEIVECAVDYDEVLDADEVFSTGNMAKVIPCVGIDDRDFQAGPVYTKARKLYFEFARDTSVF